LQQSGDLSGALAATNSGLAPHLSFIDWGGHGYTVVRADADTLQAEFVAIERPVAASATEDGGPLAYRARHRVILWKPGEQPSLEQTIIEGSPPLST
jgi:alkaline phosphatase D